VHDQRVETAALSTVERNSGPARLTIMNCSLDLSLPPPAESAGGAGRRTFVDVYTDRYQSMVQIARLTTGSNVIAEDLVQDAFADLYQRYEHVQSPDAYLRRAVVSRCTSWVRRRITERRYLEHHGDEPRAPTNPETLTVMDAVGRLPIRQRTAIVLRYFADWSEAEIAAALDCRPGTVKSLLSRARTKLSQELIHDH
jgi:RNA polymerase sigma-70 factor (sigma-E family)